MPSRRSFSAAIPALFAVALTAAPAGAAGPTPVVTSVTCTNACPGKTYVSGGSRLKLVGSHLSRVTTVVFNGAPGVQDDVSVTPSGDRTLRLTVPPDARSGTLTAWIGEGPRSRPTRPLTIREPTPQPEAPAEEERDDDPESPELRESGESPRVATAVNARRVYVGAPRRIEFLYRIQGDRPADVTVELFRVSTNAVVQTWTAKAAAPGALHRIRWTGIASGKVPPEGRYAFRLTAVGPEGARTSSAQAESEDSFDFFHHIFPVRGKHDFGGPGSRFGTARSGHSHQGHDVFARCGTKLVAARGGVVQWKRYHSAAGHYVVIDGGATGIDYAYMHLTSASPLKEGQRVETGQQIGTVGESGNAQGCHLHFELWGRPGWYEGGSPFDPLPALRHWDKIS